jgi:molybdenum cofactor cytidylyltransferase
MTGVIILAAGSSSRLGMAKQSLEYKGQTLLQRAIHSALASECETVAIVLGARAEMLQASIINEPVHVFFNKAWEEGMASSIRCGLTELHKVTPQLTAVILMLCDQPFADAAIINQLIQQAEPNTIVASAYNGTIGPPALFDKAFFPQLLTLSGNEGAKSILLQYEEDVITVPFPLGGIDIDTVADYNQLNG